MRFDVVVCLEVAEHIPRALEPVFLRNINCSAGSGLILSDVWNQHMYAPTNKGKDDDFMRHILTIQKQVFSNMSREILETSDLP